MLRIVSMLLLTLITASTKLPSLPLRSDIISYDRLRLSNIAVPLLFDVLQEWKHLPGHKVLKKGIVCSVRWVSCKNIMSAEEFLK